LVITLRFDQRDFEQANAEWGCNCGPSALAAALGITLDRAHELIPEFDDRRYTSPRMMKDALQLADVQMREITKGGGS